MSLFGEVSSIPKVDVTMVLGIVVLCALIAFGVATTRKYLDTNREYRKVDALLNRAIKERVAAIELINSSYKDLKRITGLVIPMLDVNEVYSEQELADYNNELAEIIAETDFGNELIVTNYYNSLDAIRRYRRYKDDFYDKCLEFFMDREDLVGRCALGLMKSKSLEIYHEYQAMKNASEEYSSERDEEEIFQANADVDRVATNMGVSHISKDDEENSDDEGTPSTGFNKDEQNRHSQDLNGDNYSKVYDIS